MKSYFEAYKERLVRNDIELRSLAESLKNSGYEIFIYGNDNKLLSGFKVFDSTLTKCCYVSFNEVPYLWTVSIPIKPSKNGGSYTAIRSYGGENFSLNFSIEDIAPCVIGFVDERFDHLLTKI
jgi:hypothetical protein